MKNKQQKIEFIKYDWTYDINKLLSSDEGWYVKGIYQLDTKSEYGAYVLLEREIKNKSVSETLEEIGIHIKNSNGTMKSLNEIMIELSEVWENV